MTVRFVDWARGVSVPKDFTEGQEAFVRLAYENGVRHGRDQVIGPIVEALRLEEQFGP